MWAELREAGLITYPSPMFRRLLVELREVFVAVVLPWLEPAYLSFVAQACRGCKAAVVASHLPCAGTRVGMRDLNPVDCALLARAVRAALHDSSHPGSQLVSLGYVAATDLPRAGGVVRLELDAFCTSAGRLAWAKANGCRWDEWTPASCAAGIGSLEALMWARKLDCPWDGNTAPANGRLDVLSWAREQHCPWDKDTCEQPQRAGTSTRCGGRGSTAARGIRERANGHSVRRTGDTAVGAGARLSVG
jgi:hypothetical protein